MTGNPSPPASTNKVLLIGMDGADWNLIRPLMEKGSLPAMRRMVDRGTMGNLATLSPTISPILWNSIATGKRAGKHGIHGFTEVDPHAGQVQPVSSLSRQCKAIWNILQQAGGRVHVINWFASHPAEPLNGICLSDFFPHASHPDPELPWPLPEECVHPADRRDYFEPMRIHPGELDESVGSLFVKDIKALGKEEDTRLQQLGAELARAYTVQTATLDILDNEDWNFCAAYFRTVDIIEHLFMPFHPPRMEGVPDALFAQYEDAVNSGYRFMDLLLTHLITRAGTDATIVVLSDHGFHHGDLRPGFHAGDPFANPETWHRDQGILLAMGPGVREDHLIHGATLLDVTPTLLALLGQPLGKDMDGRVLTEMLEGSPEVRYIDTWETLEGDCGKHPAEKRLNAQDASALLDQFVALGYIAPLGNDARENARQTQLQNDWNLARDYLDFGAWESALPLLEHLGLQFPERAEVGLRLAHCQFQLGLMEEVERSLGNVLHQAGEGPLLNLLRGHLAVEKGNDDEAVTFYEKAAEELQDARGIHLALGRAFLRLGRLERARTTFNRVIEHEPENAFAYQGLARVQNLLENWDASLEMATRAVSLQHNLPFSHELRGVAREKKGDLAGAIEAYEAAVLYDAGCLRCIRKLAELYQQSGQHELVAHCEQMERAAEAVQESPEDRLKRLRAAIGERRLAREARLLWEGTETLDQLRETLDARHERVEKLVHPHQRPRLEPKQEFLLVSGLPRSGTSLMMQMLSAAGLEVLTDGQREANEFNPRGYFEWEGAKQLPSDPYIIEEALGKVTKVVSQLLPHLPPDHRYRVIFMTRPVEEIQLSQQRMLEKEDVPAERSEGLSGAVLGRHRDQICSLIDQAERFDVLYVDYPALVRDPQPWIKKVIAFAGDHAPGAMDADVLRSCIEPTLYKARVEPRDR